MMDDWGRSKYCSNCVHGLLSELDNVKESQCVDCPNCRKEIDSGKNDGLNIHLTKQNWTNTRWTLSLSSWPSLDHFYM